MQSALAPAAIERTDGPVVCRIERTRGRHTRVHTPGGTWTILNLTLTVRAPPARSARQPRRRRCAVPFDRSAQSALELQACARHLVQRPLTCKEHDPELFRQIRRNESELDRWLTQRLGYRLHVNADTARLFKDGFVAERRLLWTASGRSFHPLEYTLLALVLGSTVAGPAVISLRDLVERVRSAAVEADITLEDSPMMRRGLVCVLQWMIGLGLASELYQRVDAYAADETADAVLKIRPERIDVAAFRSRGGGEPAGPAGACRAAGRDPAVDALPAGRGSGPVSRRLERCRMVGAAPPPRGGDGSAREMFGLALEARAEGIAAIDPSGLWRRCDFRRAVRYAMRRCSSFAAFPLCRCEPPTGRTLCMRSESWPRPTAADGRGARGLAQRLARRVTD